MSIYFITGTSGSGKSTLMHYLKKYLSGNQFAVYDFDQVGVPADADEKWRQETTRYWITKALEHQKQNKSTIICGVSVPSEVLSLINKFQLPVYFGFIKIDDNVIKERLEARGWNTKLIQDNIAWAHHLESQVEKQKNHLIVDGSEAPPSEIAEQFAAWILKLETS